MDNKLIKKVTFKLMNKLWIIKSYFNYSLKVKHFQYTCNNNILFKYNFVYRQYILISKNKLYKKIDIETSQSSPCSCIPLTLPFSLQVTSFITLLYMLSVFLFAYTNTYTYYNLIFPILQKCNVHSVL